MLDYGVDGEHYWISMKFYKVCEGQREREERGKENEFNIFLS